ncbi:MAG: histidine phosphatase family protein [Gammaproteobacteria bacterium]|nr:histidine phosphatase family protein [Gammaproteobacteria bacterium]NND39348.1 histidine phosphatase family protein [Pseudomonadales bacterium]NNM10495.1 histidine phosphatase family protein [Pseudomonadales bacterium]RZV55034.1 MAG: histidine phosphatase family protein [Pseudomonadales bacterium]
MSELYLVRHGQASLGSDNYDQLSELGYRQSQALGNYVSERELSFDFLLTGTLQRHLQTLDGIAANAQLHGVDRAEHAGLNEYDFHSLVASYAKQHSQDPLVIAAKENPRDAKLFYRLLRQVLTAWSRDALAGGSETYSGFVQRIRGVAEDIQRQADRGGRILAVSSGGAISQFVGVMLGLAPEKVFELNLQARNTGITQFFFNEKKYNLLQFNGIAHLDHPDRRELISF